MHPGLVATGIVDDIVAPLMKPLLGLVKHGLPILRAREDERRSPEVSYDAELRKRVWAARPGYAEADRTSAAARGVDTV